ncbi:MAG: sigma 54-interacting transcriptional regulator [Desulfomicrobium sp.]|nr:sigma 54-interacting transcriptional regulator [Pseudomonadota bacterium]MBV1711457.1 sigma 54-interacting transcriptional regulator [Desulfomicrobium sp.]MBU4570859.1 sigma 54-interacting transcriptional regulator [Pseudomonadota bacterium]MBU4595349.1 sigma 54-interacting transcriptional regulator [Pseudomonadota bacterium]MBV1720781.1 sigma 54-interacting transcriptional regulator [Desulfomicrobium sp.]
MLKRIEELIGNDCPDLPSLLDGLPVGVALLDDAGRVLMLNKALEALTGYSRDEVRGMPCRHVLRSRACVQGCPHGRDDLPGAGVETDCINRHRRKIPVRITPVRVSDGNNRPVCVLDVVEDLTAMREIEARLSQATGQGQIVGRSPIMEKLLRLVPVIAQHDTPVLITGETGTGKDLLAESTHKASPRSREPFVRFSCGPMPPELLDAELFGRMLDGTAEFKPGRFQQAQGGTLYLSEIADLPLPQQMSLVRFLDEGVVLPLGASKTVRVNVRLMASTAESPERLVRAGQLREDLFHRIAAIRLHLPRLKERGEDLGFLLHHYLNHYAARFKKNIKGISPEALRLLCSHDFPGNVRELKNIMEFAAMVCTDDNIGIGHLPGHLPGLLESAPAKSRAATGRKSGRKHTEER